MKCKRVFALAMAAVLMAGLAGCGSDKDAVYVQSVAELANQGGIAPGDRFMGLVVSENVTEIQKDSDKTVEECYVTEGQDVKTGDKLFSYDTEQLQLALDKQRLELEQLDSSIESYKEQITQLEKDRNKASAKDKLEYTVQIQTAQVSQKEAEINKKTKEAEVKKSEETLENATVVSPVDGRIQSINESGTDSNGNPVAYMSIQKVGAYRVKGTINELQRGSIQEGDAIKLTSRTDESQTWTGVVSRVDYENPVQGNQNSYYISSSSGDDMSNSSRYPFYVQLDSTEGLILGQHLYMELATDGEAPTGLNISSAFICFEDDGSAYVWAESHGKLEKRTVTVGDYNGERDTYEILDGLAEADYIAMPGSDLVKAGASTTHVEPTEATEEPSGDVDMDMEGGVA